MNANVLLIIQLRNGSLGLLLGSKCSITKVTVSTSIAITDNLLLRFTY